MSYKYIDPGFGFYSGYTANIGFTQPLLGFENYMYNPRFGVSFYTDESYSNGYNFLVFENNTGTPAEFYLKFDEYFPAVATNAQTVVKNGDFIILTILQEGAVVRLTALNDEELSVTGSETYLNLGAVNTIWLHAEADGETGRITLAINGNYIFRGQEGWGFTGPITHGFSFSVSEQLPVSNFIVSDEPINLNETIVEIGYSGVETTMIAESGTYASAIASDYVLQTLDPSSLYNQLNPETRVTALLAVAAPAYTTGGAVKYLKSRVVDSGNTTDGDWLSLEKMTEEEFAELEGGAPFLASQIDIASDTTFATLSGLRVGWVTGA